MNYDTSGANASKYRTSGVAYPTWPSPITWLDSTRKYSTYANYTASAVADKMFQMF